jgi:hypothetical protein
VEVTFSGTLAALLDVVAEVLEYLPKKASRSRHDGCLKLGPCCLDIQCGLTSYSAGMLVALHEKHDVHGKIQYMGSILLVFPTK